MVPSYSSISGTLAVFLLFMRGLGDDQYFSSVWNDTIRTYVCENAPNHFAQEPRHILSTRQMSFEDIEVGDIQ
jgi:hypothetical protein